MTLIRPMPKAVDLRPPSEVMRLARMGASFPTRLSFMRSLLRRMTQERVQVTRLVWRIDAQGYGRAVYTVRLGGHAYSLVAFSTPLEDAMRTDRVIAERWDTSYVLFDGVPDAADLDRLHVQVPLQEAGRFRPTELVLCRANKSLRLFDHVVARLAQGRQPDLSEIARVGYLMRTTAVYGNGKFGIADRARIAERPALGVPFQAEMLAVWLVRGFTLDLVEHIAAAQNCQAARLDPALRRHLGIGNATGLGMAPFLVNHPILLNNWILARETALARLRSQRRASEDNIALFEGLVARACAHVAQWQVADARQAGRIARLQQDLEQLQARTKAGLLRGALPWDALIRQSRAWSVETQELVIALALEPQGALVDDLALEMACISEPWLQPKMQAGALKRLIAQHYDWALRIDFRSSEATARFWYVSEEKLEPRLGQRGVDPGADKELPLDIARQVQALWQILHDCDPDQSVAHLALRWPNMRGVIARVQAAPAHPYAEIRDNLIGAECVPIDMLRCKLAFFGASKFDPKSDRWTRVTLFQGAPGFDEIAQDDAEDWAFPAYGAQ